MTISKERIEKIKDRVFRGGGCVHSVNLHDFAFLIYEIEKRDKALEAAIKYLKWGKAISLDGAEEVLNNINSVLNCKEVKP